MNMATIEERAEIFASIYSRSEQHFAEKCYIQGTVEQREIDIEKACEWLKRELADPMPDELYKQWCEEKLDEFKNYMIL